MSPDAPDTDPDVSLAHELELRLAGARGALSGNDELIARFLRDHLDELAFQTAESLAQGSGVSAAAIVRFARRLGYASFRELRDRARTELRTNEPGPSAPREPKGAHSLLARKARTDIANLELLPRLVGERLEAAAQLVAAARSIWLLANRETHGLTVYIQRLLHQAHPRVDLINPAYPDALRDLGPDDALIACTFRPYAVNTLELLAEARTRGVRIVLITDGLAHEFISPTDLVLVVPVDSPSLFLSFTPAVCVLECLAALIAAQDPDLTYETLESTARFVEAHGLMASPRVPAAERRRPRRRR